MTDRIQTLTVFLDQDYRSDDILGIINAISMIKGVEKVDLGPAVNSADYIARERVKIDCRYKLHDAIEKIFTHKEEDHGHNPNR